jgi:glycosyltransferase involved in cell wall biosynthesis
MLTVQILLKNNKDTIRKTLDSVSGLGRIVVGNLGSDDGSLEICSSYGVDVIDVVKKSDFSVVRNGLAGDGLNFYLEAWEFLARGREEIISADGPKRVCVISGRMASKETRIWQGKNGFSNPVYETIVDHSARYDPRIVIVSGSSPNLESERRAMVEKWLESRPTSCEPYYYMAFSCLYERKYEEFFFYAKKYMAMERNPGVESVLLCYYMAQIELHMGRLNEASSHIVFCLSVRPMMAEFWCLLGDMFYKQNKFGKARSMYENAIIIGKSRKNSDPYPVEIFKYKEYPSKMINNIDEISEDMIKRMGKANDK